MNDASLKRIKYLEKKFSSKNIIVVGDMMLDCYFRGDVKRISPEAPVPVIEIENEFFRFGGAANVALNISKLGGNALPVGVIGNDNDGKIFKNLIKQSGISDDGIFPDPNRPTTTKTRVIAQGQHVVRIDKETKVNINSKIEAKILNFISSRISWTDGIIIEDYNKGVLTVRLIKAIITLAKKNSVMITVDPKFNNFYEYKNVRVFKPNRKEAEDVLGMKISSDEEIRFAGREIQKKLGADYVLLTLGEGGIAIFEKNKPERRLPTKARVVADVSGAGDTVISTLTMALAAGADIYEACYLANFAGGLVCEEVGIVPIEHKKLFSAVYGEAKK